MIESILTKLGDVSSRYAEIESLLSQPDVTSNQEEYIKLSKEHHPDLLISKGVPIEVINESKNKMRAINAAWDQIQKLKNN